MLFHHADRLGSVECPREGAHSDHDLGIAHPESAGNAWSFFRCRLAKPPPMRTESITYRVRTYPSGLRPERAAPIERGPFTSMILKVEVLRGVCLGSIVIPNYRRRRSHCSASAGRAGGWSDLSGRFTASPTSEPGGTVQRGATTGIAGCRSRSNGHSSPVRPAPLVRLGAWTASIGTWGIHQVAS